MLNDGKTSNVRHQKIEMSLPLFVVNERILIFQVKGKSNRNKVDRSKGAAGRLHGSCDLSLVDQPHQLWYQWS